MSTTITPPRRTRRWRPVLTCLAVLVLVPVVAYFVMAWLRGRDLDRAIAETEQVDPRWRLDDLQADRKTFADDRNAALQVMRATTLVGGRRFDLINGSSAERFFEKLLPSAQLNEQQRGALHAAFAKLPDGGLDAARKVREFPDGGRFPIAPAADYFSIDLSAIQGCREVMAVLEFDAMLRGDEQDARGAMESCRALLCAARAVGDEPQLLAYLVRVAGHFMTLRSVERALAQGIPPDDELKALQELLEREAGNDAFLQALRGERADLHRTIDRLRDGSLKFSELGGNNSGAATTDYVIAFFPSLIANAQADHLRLMNAAIEAAKLPPEKQSAAMKEVEQHGRDSSAVTRMLVPDFIRAADARSRSLAMLRTAAVAVAAERHRQKYNSWPVSLDALVKAGYLKHVPADPFDGQPLRFRRLPDGLVIYSIGQDRADDKGRLNRTDPTAPGGDLGVRLWSPAERRQAALPPVPVEPDDHLPDGVMP